MAEIQVLDMNLSKRLIAGIGANVGSVYFSEYKGKRTVGFQAHELSRVVALGQGVKSSKYGGMYFEYPWETGKTYKLMVAMASDSADRICLFSAYIFLPGENKWKLIGSRGHPFYRDRLVEPTVFLKAHKKTTGSLIINDVWCQRSNGSWKYMSPGTPSEKEEHHPLPLSTISDIGIVQSSGKSI